MRQIIYLLTFVSLMGCGQSKTDQTSNLVADTLNAKISETIISDNSFISQQDSTDENQTEEYRKESLNGFEKATLYKLTDTIMTDFNGDGFLDKAFYKKENETSGIIIKHGKTNEEFRIGFGKNFSFWTDFECNWVDYWGLVEDRETSETTFTEDGEVLGSKQVILQNNSIVLGADEVGGGLITFINGQYVWIHLTC